MFLQARYQFLKKYCSFLNHLLFWSVFNFLSVPKHPPTRIKIVGEQFALGGQNLMGEEITPPHESQVNFDELFPAGVGLSLWGRVESMLLENFSDGFMGKAHPKVLHAGSPQSCCNQRIRPLWQF